MQITIKQIREYFYEGGQLEELDAKLLELLESSKEETITIQVVEAIQ